MFRFCLTTLIFFFGLTYPQGAKAQLEITWTKLDPLPTPFAYHNMGSTDSCLILCGGSGEYTMMLYSLTSNSWRWLPADHSNRAFSSSVMHDDQFYVFGGIMNNNMRYTAQCAVFDLASMTWRRLPDLPASHSRSAAAHIDGLIYVTGGLTGATDKNARNSHHVYIYDPLKDKWFTSTSLSEGRHGHACISIDNKIYVLGGYTDEGPSSDVEIYHPETERWTSGMPMPTARGFFGAAKYKDRYIITVGGRTVGAPIEIYDTVRDEWSTLKPLDQVYQRFGLDIIGDQIFISGGENNPTIFLAGRVIPD